MAQTLRILHCMRAPVGGLFRHVRDLAEAQAAHGHEVGVICDGAASDALTSARLDELSRHTALGLHRLDMSRELSLSDMTATRRAITLARTLKIDVLHGHGAKGGAYARLASVYLKRRGLRGLRTFYTPHGGSLHYERSSLKGRMFLALERMLEPAADGIIFESAFSADAFAAKVGVPRTRMRVIPNGLQPYEFETARPCEQATDFLFVGELRRLKGVDVLLEAMAILNRERPASLLIVGAGPDGSAFESKAAELGLGGIAIFAGAMPAREAFALGRVLVVPSRAESFPYIVLEAAAAGVPMIASRVGGIPEITAGTPASLVPAGEPQALAGAMLEALNSPVQLARCSRDLREHVAKRFTVAGMADQILGFYGEAKVH